jgi:hypothetical protein
MIICPYKYKGIWVFDDEATGLIREAFVSGVDEMIDRIVSEIPDAKNGFVLLFSDKHFPSSTVKLEWIREDESGIGNWYFCQQYGINGWLCPALFKYFKTAPMEIYVEAREIKP